MVSGTKLTFFLGMIGVGIAGLLANLGAKALGLDATPDMMAGQWLRAFGKSQLAGFLTLPITAVAAAVPMQFGLTRARGETPQLSDAQKVLERAGPLIAAGYLTSLLFIVGFVLGLGIGGIIAVILVSPTAIVILAYDYGAVEGVKTCVRAVWSNFGVALGLVLYSAGALFLIVPTLGIFTLWALPFMTLCETLFVLRVLGPPTSQA